MEPVEVTARFDETGKIWPEWIVWQGRKLRVEGIGRRWERDGAQHILVIALGGRVFELVFQPASSSWLMRVSDPGPKYA
jgi:hypothetical protein